MPRLGAVPIADVSHEDAVKLHDRLRATPILANRVLAVLSKLLAWSMTKAKYRPAGANPCHGIEKYEERRRKRYLDAAEYARLGRALRTADIAPAPRTAIELLLLTGCRPQEIATLQWAHVDLARRGAAPAGLEDRREDDPPVAASREALETLAAVCGFAVRVSWHRAPTAKGAHLHAVHAGARVGRPADRGKARGRAAVRCLSAFLRVGGRLAAWAEPRADW